MHNYLLNGLTMSLKTSLTFNINVGNVRYRVHTCLTKKQDIFVYLSHVGVNLEQQDNEQCLPLLQLSVEISAIKIDNLFEFIEFAL